VSTLAVLVALPVSAGAIALLLRSSLSSRLVASPSADRWHDRATPTFGGVGIFAGLVAGTLAALAVGALEPSLELGGILAGATILFLAGLADDAFSFGVPPKLAAQVAAAAVVLASGIHVEIVDNDLLAAVIGVVWVIGMTNAFNLLDNIDGLAATLAGIALVFFAIDAGGVHDDELVLVVALAGALACAGFLPFNVRASKPAAVFMGDSGSQVLGFTLAALSLEASWKLAGTTVATLLLPILVLAVPIVDTALVIAVRLLEGRPIY
jgi:UDP-GlcNAc:undecaprenyl-phosphate/decaprenyl-phosphate GlcNAc-1-phosphate transferase